MTNYDSLLVVSFGGPEGPDQVMPFLERVTKGRGVPYERLKEVEEHYLHYGGISPINQQNRDLIYELKKYFSNKGLELPIYFGNRNSPPFLKDTLEEMKNDGRKKALAFFTSLFSCYSGCRQYRENILEAQNEVGVGAPLVEKLRFGFNHPNFIKAMAARVNEELILIPAERRKNTKLIYTAHSIPNSMAKGAAYEIQLNEAARLVNAELDQNYHYSLCYQSRSGAPHIPWLEPDVNDQIKAEAELGTKDIVLVPIGFISDHIEVLFDLDEEAKETGAEHNINVYRAKTVGTHPLFVEMIYDLIVERMNNRAEKSVIGDLGAWHDVCPVGCCPYERPSGRP